VLSIVCNTLSMTAASVRARVRAEMIDEIKRVARDLLGTHGATFSLREVARQLGIVSSGIYRYFPSRDELLTALIIDAYNALGETVEAADRLSHRREDLRARWGMVCRAVRTWALQNPAQYALIFGSPVPGYAAPQDTIPAAVRTPAVLVGILADGHKNGVLRQVKENLPRHLRTDLIRARDEIAPGLPESLLARGMVAWVHLFGMVSFELFGQFNNVIEAREKFFDYQMGLMADLVGL
jgi:AcrR family transcriptional regulator